MLQWIMEEALNHVPEERTNRALAVRILYGRAILRQVRADRRLPKASVRLRLFPHSRSRSFPLTSISSVTSSLRPSNTFFTDSTLEMTGLRMHLNSFGSAGSCDRQKLDVRSTPTRIREESSSVDITCRKMSREQRQKKE